MIQRAVKEKIKKESVSFAGGIKILYDQADCFETLEFLVTFTFFGISEYSLLGNSRNKNTQLPIASIISCFLYLASKTF